jgi:hypothetical protein
MVEAHPPFSRAGIGHGITYRYSEVVFALEFPAANCAVIDDEATPRSDE